MDLNRDSLGVCTSADATSRATGGAAAAVRVDGTREFGSRRSRSAGLGGSDAPPLLLDRSEKSRHTSATMARLTGLRCSAIPFTSALSQITLMVLATPPENS